MEATMVGQPTHSHSVSLSVGKLTSRGLGTCKFCRRGLYQCCVAETVNGISKNGGCKLRPAVR